MPQLKLFKRNKFLPGTKSDLTASVGDYIFEPSKEEIV
jgi:hypothetical protein